MFYQNNNVLGVDIIWRFDEL